MQIFYILIFLYIYTEHSRNHKNFIMWWLKPYYNTKRLHQFCMRSFVYIYFCEILTHLDLYDHQNKQDKE